MQGWGGATKDKTRETRVKLDRQAHFHPQSVEIGVLRFFFLRLFFFFFWMWAILKVFVELATILLPLLFMFWIFDCKACGILVPNQRVKPEPPGLKAWF